MIFSNFDSVADSPMKERLLRFADIGIKSVLPSYFMPEAVALHGDVLRVQDKEYHIDGRRIFVVGAGKASAAMAMELEHILGKERITAGVVVSHNSSITPEKIEIHEADHPLPSEKGVSGTKKLLSLRNQFCFTEKDLVIVLLSGGGSALIPYPVPGVSLADKQKMTEILMCSGASVHEATILKKKVSQVKGGKLAKYFHPTPIVSLVLSDVVGNDLSVIASGPFAHDTTTFKDAKRVIDRYGISKNLPLSINAFIQNNLDKEFYGPSLEHVDQTIIADNDRALRQIQLHAQREGLNVVVQSRIQGETKKVAYNIIMDLQQRAVRKPTLFLYGGETTVTLPIEHGVGGRNQEFILSCLHFLKKRPLGTRWSIASIGTDGTDFIEESTGGVIDDSTLQLVKEKAIDTYVSLESHDAHDVLKRINANVYVHGSTGTNVCDIMMFLLIP